MTSRTTGNQTSVLARLRQPVRPVRTKGPILGAAPQVSLLPAEVRDAAAVARHRRRLIGLVCVVVVVAAGLAAGATSVATGSQSRLAAEQARTQLLGRQVRKFSDIRSLQTKIAVGEAAMKVGGSTIIDWDHQISLITADMPSGYSVASISATGATPLADYPQGLTPLEPRRSATVTMVIETPSVGFEYSHWLTLLRNVPSAADATAVVASDGDKSVITLTVHLNPSAIDGKTEAERQ